MRILVLLSCLLCSSAFCQQSWWNAVAAQQAPVAAGGAPNNVFLASGHYSGSQGNSGTQTSNLGGSTVTNGNTILVGVAIFENANTWSFAAANITKTAGTATIGTVLLDCFTNLGTGGTNVGVAIFRVPVTGNGTLTLTFTASAGYFAVIGAGEFVNLAASPLGPTGTGLGTGNSHTTGSVSTPNNGVMLYVASEVAAANFTRTPSDTVIYEIDTASSSFTGLVQFKLVTNSATTTMTDSTGTQSVPWKLAYALYKSN